MNVSVFGLGYVGCITSGCLIEQGNFVVGVDIDNNKVNMINHGESTVVEKGIGEFIRKGIKNNLIEATTSESDAVKKSDIAIICVGTPGTEQGHLDMKNIYSVVEKIAKILSEKNDFYIIIVRSTVMPGTFSNIVEIIEKISNKKCGDDFNVFIMPEFLREGNAIHDFYNPPYTLVGHDQMEGIHIVEELFSFLSAPLIRVDVKIVELIKLISNSYHALKVSFANEIGRVCKKLDIDSQLLMELFKDDKLLNISSKYFNPGFSFGGSCLPKDLNAFNSIAKNNSVKVPILSATQNSNDVHNKHVFDLIKQSEKKNIGIYGLSFKAGTDDIRNSPSLKLCSSLVEKGYNIKIFDRNINFSKMIGKNKEILLRDLKNIESLFTSDFNEFLFGIEVLVFTQFDKEIEKLADRIYDEIKIIDLVGIEILKRKENYEGVCW